MTTPRIPAIKVLLLPKDTNAHGTIFGGVILSHIDLASAIEPDGIRCLFVPKVPACPWCRRQVPA